MASANKAVLDLLHESLLRQYVQMGNVGNVKTAPVGGQKGEYVVIEFNGVDCYCKREDFIKRQTSLAGFLGTKVPFLVKSITPDGHVIVSRLEAIPKVVKRFLRTVNEGDTVRGTVTGVLENGLVFVEVEGFPCLIPPGEWDYVKIPNLEEMIRIGSQIEAKVINIEEYTPNETDNEKEREVEFGYRIRLSRKSVLNEEVAKIWHEIEEHYAPGDQTEAKIVGFGPGYNTYFLELPKRVVILGNLRTTLRRQYGQNLPSGLKVHVEIRSMDKEKRKGRATIFRIDPTLQQSMNGYAGF
ncbi:S1 RNA-binding domain-containing protein [Paenibacillus thiaminolyticus]|uniref:S1 RNA-binding domain-containing protein n=1 Tax=Paenibacillus thiaminolyticus TaxID=49283 RepID=A0A3A3GHH5_PANTH|nr:S1 RNA-binding domain-containing protein [Paenibacillus thiaminolyticus]RJG21339.1 S1 RNA-binding domain-containing protein [Paenibacillus thiaminolyticus]